MGRILPAHKANMFNNPDPVDGFSDSQSGTVGEPDPGRPGDAPKPLSPEEYAAAQKEARKPDEEKK